MDHDTAERFAQEWIAAWNAHDLDRILAPYAEDVVFASPHVVDILGDASGEVHGKPALRDYWAKGLRDFSPGLHFTLQDVKTSRDTVVITYRNERGQSVSECLTFRGDEVCRGFAAYGRVPAT